MAKSEMSTNRATSKGVLRAKANQGMFTIARHLPANDLEPFVQHYWIARWDLRDRPPYITETLPYPGVNLVFEPNQSRIFGIFTGKSDKTLQGKSQACAILFRPGGFDPFLKSPIAEFTDSSLDLAATFGSNIIEIEQRLLASDDDASMIETVEEFLRRREPQQDSQLRLIRAIIDWIIDDRTITKVKQVCDRFESSERTLQEIFHTYVGIGVKWVIMRYRLQDAVQRISTGETIDWVGLALDLGYTDQPHFIKDFKKIIGQTPANYRRAET